VVVEGRMTIAQPAGANLGACDNRPVSLIDG
jgi:hypothetical protein